MWQLEVKIASVVHLRFAGASISSKIERFPGGYLEEAHCDVVFMTLLSIW